MTTDRGSMPVVPQVEVEGLFVSQDVVTHSYFIACSARVDGGEWRQIRTSIDADRFRGAVSTEEGQRLILGRIRAVLLGMVKEKVEEKKQLHSIRVIRFKPKTEV